MSQATAVPPRLSTCVGAPFLKRDEQSIGVVVKSFDAPHQNQTPTFEIFVIDSRNVFLGLRRTTAEQRGDASVSDSDRSGRIAAEKYVVRRDISPSISRHWTINFAGGPAFPSICRLSGQLEV
jgi:hypothetical protein